MSITSSVIICTRNRVHDTVQALSSLRCQTVAPTEIIIVDSSDSPIAGHAEFQQIFDQKHFAHTQLVYMHTKPGLPYQRNVGIAHARYDLLYFFDDDVQLSADYIAQMNHAFIANPEYAGGMGTISNIGSKDNRVLRTVRQLFLLQRNYAAGRFTVSGMPTHPYGTQSFKTVELLGGCCMAYRRSAIGKHLFDESLNGYAYMEDCDFSRRVSYHSPLFFNPQAQLQHFNSPLSRDSVIKNRAMFVRNYSYLFFKNFYPYNRLKIVAYGWTMLGLLIDAFARAAVTRNMGYVYGYWLGMMNYWGGKK